MTWSKATRISVMLFIDTAFFFVEIVAGWWVGSLALMADAFHMLNDIISLAIGLWAVRMSQRPSTDEFSFGYKRYEILGAFFNAVFLIALCVSIVLEALPRLVDPPVITNPMLILYVGCAGLVSNFAGFFVLGGFHAGHSHGDEEQGHGHDELHDAEEGYSDHRAHNDAANAGDVHPEVLDGGAPEQGGSQVKFVKAAEEEGTSPGSLPRIRPKLVGQSPASKRSHHRSASSSRYEGYESNQNLLPSRFREGVIVAAQPPSLDGADSEEATESESEVATVGVEANEESPLISKASERSSKEEAATYVKSKSYYNDHDHSGSHRHTNRHSFKTRHANHNHNKPREKKSGGHSHNHADMGMNAMILHVIGDALGNVGVIVSALVIWLSGWAFKYYVDPAVSLFIAMIILKSCLPLSWASGKILCQATPEGIDLSEIKEDLQNIDGVVNCHHVHVWQLSDSTIIASLHLRVAFGRAVAKDEVSYMSKYMETVNNVQECLHEYGIHSATIQPEFCWDNENDLLGVETENGLVLDGPLSRRATGKPLGGDDCILECVANCEGDGCCVPTNSTRVSRNASLHSHDSHSGHSH